MTSVLSDSSYVIDSLPEVWFGLVMVSFGVYLLLDGFDFGLGMLYAEADETERRTILAAFGPLWKANEVWLVLFGTVLFAGFPAVYANLLGRQYLLVFAILFALGLRGLGSKLREEDVSDRWVRFWDACFVAGSAFSPFLLGMLAGSWVLGEPAAIAPGPVLVGLTVVALSVVLGAFFLGVKTEGTLRDRVLARGRVATVCYLAVLVVTAIGLYLWYPDTREALVSVPTAVVVVGSGLFAATALYAQSTERYRVGLGAASGLAVLLVALVSSLMYPSIDPAAGLAIRDAVVSPLPLNMTSVVATIFMPVLLVYFVFLYSLFSGPASPEQSYG